MKMSKISFERVAVYKGPAQLDALTGARRAQLLFSMGGETPKNLATPGDWARHVAETSGGSPEEQSVELWRVTVDDKPVYDFWYYPGEDDGSLHHLDAETDLSLRLISGDFDGEAVDGIEPDELQAAFDARGT